MMTQFKTSLKFLAGLALAQMVIPAFAAVAVDKQPDKRPNIIYILVDDMGYGDLGAYGQQKIKTPNIDQLAAEGMKFTNHYAGSTVCGPSRASLMTGLHTGHSPIRGNPRWTNSGTPVDLTPKDVTVAKVLQDAGYYTGLIGKWGLSESETDFNASMPNQQGFDFFYGYRRHNHAHYHYWDKMFRNNDIEVIKGNDPMTNTGQYNQDVFTKEAVQFLDRQASGDSKDKPFFLYLSYAVPHLAVTVPEDSKEQYKGLGWPIRKMNTTGHYKNDADGHTAYAGMISRLDDHVGLVMQALKDQGIDDNTLVIFASDNGHEYDKNFFNSNSDLRGKKRDLYEGGIRIPFIARWPSSIKEGSGSDHISAFWDFMPTACDIAGVDKCPKNDGISFLPTLTGNGSQKQHSHLYWEFNEKQGPLQAVRAGKWKLVTFKGKKTQLFDLSKDIGETTNIAANHPKVTARLLGYIAAARSDHPEFTLRKLSPGKKKKKK